MHGQVDVTVQQAFPQGAHKHARAADVGQVGSGDVAERGQPDEFDLPAGARGDQPGNLTGLGQGHGALAGAQPQRRPALHHGLTLPVADMRYVTGPPARAARPAARSATTVGATLAACRADARAASSSATMARTAATSPAWLAAREAPASCSDSRPITVTPGRWPALGSTSRGSARSSRTSGRAPPDGC